jgi:hypothetical protein
LRQPIRQRLQGHPDAPDPLRHRRAREQDLIACGYLLESIQRQMIQVFADEHPHV